MKSRSLSLISKLYLVTDLIRRKYNVPNIIYIRRATYNIELYSVTTKLLHVYFST